MNPEMLPKLCTPWCTSVQRQPSNTTSKQQLQLLFKIVKKNQISLDTGTATSFLLRCWILGLSRLKAAIPENWKTISAMMDCVRSWTTSNDGGSEIESVSLCLVLGKIVIEAQ